MRMIQSVRRSALLALLAAGLLSGQEKTTVPLSSPGQAATVKVNLVHGSIYVVAGAAGQIVVESGKLVLESGKPGTEKQKQKNAPPAGMHRIDIGRQGLDIEEDHNVVTITASHSSSGAGVTIQVPANASLKLHTVNGGHIDVTGVTGEIEVENTNGSILLKNVVGPVLAHTVNGSVTASFDRVAGDKPMAFTSVNGNVDVTVPGDTKARLRMKTTHGSVFSDFEVKLEADTTKPVVEDARGNGGKYKIRMDHSATGTVNGGGPEYRFETLNGNILIHRK